MRKMHIKTTTRYQWAQVIRVIIKKTQILVNVGEDVKKKKKGETFTLLVGMEIGADTMGKGRVWKFLRKLKDHITE